MTIPSWTDQSGPTPGTSLSAANLNAMTDADTTEAATNDALGSSSTYVNNLNRIRYQLAVIFGAAWNAAKTMVQLSPASQQTGTINVSGTVTTGGGVIAANQSQLAHGTFTDPLVGTAVGLKVSGALAADRLYAKDPLHYSGQTGNTNTALQNQPVSTLTVPAGTVNGATLSVNNAYCQAHSYIFFTVFQNVDVHIRGIQLVSTTPGTFTVMVLTDGANVSSSTSVQYRIDNIATE